MNRILCVLALAVGACSDLRDLEPNRCGNGILEAGEDCDSKDERCVACGIKCDFVAGATEDAQCEQYPNAAGFVCGADDFCHAPGGSFREPHAVSTAVETFRATDINRDGYDDLLIQSSTAIRALFGSPEANLSTGSSVLTPIARGHASYADLDVDGRLDVLLPAADGVVAYTSPYDVLSPFPFPSLINVGMTGTPLFSHGLAPGVIGFIGMPPSAPLSAQAAYIIRFVADQPGAPPAPHPLCGATGETFEPAAVDLFQVNAGYLLLAATFKPASGTQKLCVLGIQAVGNSYTVTEIPVSLGTGRVPASRPVLAPIGPGACPSLVIKEATAGNTFALDGVGTTTCSFAAPATARVLSTSDASPIAWIPLTPPGPGNSTVAIAMTSGVFAVPPAPSTGPLGVAPPLYLADRPLRSVVVTDLDRDGDVDIIANASTITGDLVEDIDVLYRISGGFIRYRFDTDGPVDLLTIGDYDGNSYQDVGYVQTRVLAGAARNELVIAYGTPDQLLAGTTTGTYGRIISLLAQDVPDSSDLFGVVDDLVVLFSDAEGTKITIMHGSPQRTLLGFLDPRVAPIPSVFRAVVAGNFNDDVGAPGLDILAIEDGDGSPAPRVWRTNGPNGSEVEGSEPLTVSMLADCRPSANQNGFCIDGARYVSWPASENHDRVIAFGQNSAKDAQVITFDPHGGSVNVMATTWPSQAEIPKTTKFRSVDVLTVDGQPILAISLVPTMGEPFRLVLCAVDRQTAMPTGCYDLGARLSLTQLGKTECTAATTARVRRVDRFDTSPSFASDLLALCTSMSGTRVFVVDVQDGELRGLKVLLSTENARELRSGDIDGNGLDDLITVDRDNGIATVRVYQQCSSRDLGCSRDSDEDIVEGMR
ncbi:MAG: VCBS repeat-containing protein [Deltaproteobacteria bacterium]|nr:VCBS repeat-containing protein [Deltaproteobacteria bacterium]MDQ3301179.1 VCBS repeat-containing protein [Myxococcota bacterium]